MSDATETTTKKKAAKKHRAHKFHAHQLAIDLLDKRKRHDLSYRDIAAESGLDGAVIHRIASKKPITIETFVAIVNWLGKPINRYF